MAAPAWSDVVQSGSASLVTPIVISMPTNLATGDRVVVFITMGRNRTQGLSWNNGTTGFVSALGGTTFNTAGNDHEHDVGYADIAGSPPSTISVTPSQTKAWLAWAGRIPAGTFDPSTAPEFTTTPNSADPANLDPSWTEDTLFIAGISADELTFITFPLADDQDSDETGLVAGAVCSIGQTGGAARNVAAWATTEANLKGVATVCIRASAAGTPATVTPAVIATTTSLPAAGSNVAAGPAVVAATTSLPSSARSIAAGPAVTAVGVALPQVSAGQSITVQPVVIAAVVTVPQAGASVAAGPAVTASLAALPQAATATGATVSPSAVATAVSLPAAGVNVAASPAVTASVAALPQATAGVATVVQPAAVAVVAALPSAGVSVSVGPAVVQVPAALPPAAPVVEGSAVAQPGVIALTAAVLLAAPSAAAVVLPAAVAALTGVPTATVRLTAVPTPASVAVSVTLARPTVPSDEQPAVADVGVRFVESIGASHRETAGVTYREQP